MSLQEDVYKWHRIVMVRSRRATTGLPDPLKPEVDSRGHTDKDHSPIVGVVQDNEIIVRLVRQRIDNAAPLFVTSSDITVATVISPAKGALPRTANMEVRLRGIKGGNPLTSQIQVHFGSDTGPIIHKLIVWVFKPLTVAMTPHMVTIADAAGNSTGTIANVNDIMKLVAAIWQPCGINISIQPTVQTNVVFATQGIVSDTPFPGELNKLTSNKDWVPKTINAYFVNQIGTGSFLGFGFSRAAASTFHVTNPGIILADTTASGTVRDTFFWANDLAHEAGHFFGLWHPESLQPPNEREDTWSRRMLMHNYNFMRQHNPWPAFDSQGNAYQYRPLLDDVGYGTGRRGCMLTMKHLSQLTTDGECITARSTISSTAGPY